MTDSLRSPLKALVHAPTGRTLRMGRRRPPPMADRFMNASAATFFLDTSPKRPARTDHWRAAERCLRQVLMNDQLGCCTVSGMLHLLGVFIANSGAPCPTWSNALVQDLYERTGWRPGHPETDQGWDEISALDSWMRLGLTPAPQRHTLAGVLSVDSGDVERMKLLIYLFENLYFGWELPDAWVGADMPSRDGFTWDVAGDANPDNGHCTVGVDYDDAKPGVIFDTWGYRGLVTWKAIEKYSAQANGGEVHCVISTDSLVRATQKAPNGFDWPQLVGYFNDNGGNVQPLAHLIA